MHNLISNYIINCHFQQVPTDDEHCNSHKWKYQSSDHLFCSSWLRENICKETKENSFSSVDQALFFSNQSTLRLGEIRACSLNGYRKLQDCKLPIPTGYKSRLQEHKNRMNYLVPRVFSHLPTKSLLSHIPSDIRCTSVRFCTPKLLNQQKYVSLFFKFQFPHKIFNHGLIQQTRIQLWIV